jgi:archaeosortase A (PGF-CTERM-specific)
VTHQDINGLTLLLATLGTPTVSLIIGYMLFLSWHDSDIFSLISSLVLFLGLILLGIGYWKKHHCLRSSGWIIFAIYWATQPGHFLDLEDLVNTLFIIVGVYFLFYLAYHEYLSHTQNNHPASLDFIAGTTFIAGFSYFLIEKISFLSGFLIKIVADQTAWALQLLGYNVAAQGIIYNQEIHVPITVNGETSVYLILACTGIQSMIIFVGAIAALPHVDNHRRWKAFLGTVPVIYILNIIRNMGVIYGIEVLGYSFAFMHHVVGKIGSLIALLILAFFAFSVLPELYDNIMGLIDLPKRKGPLETYILKK